MATEVSEAMGAQQNTTKDTGGKFDAKTDELNAEKELGKVSFSKCDMDGNAGSVADSLI